MKRFPKAVLTSLILTGLLLPGGHYAVHAFSQGAPDSACQTMIPNHSGLPQEGEAPYTVKASAVEVFPGDTVTVTIQGKRDSDEFKGFMATAHSVGFNVGAMVTSDDRSKTICNGFSITHTSPKPTREVSFKWKAPDDVLEGTPINIEVTVVKEFTLFWTKMEQIDPLVIAVPPPDLPPAPADVPGKAADTTTVSGTGVLPTPGDNVGPPVTTHETILRRTEATKATPGEDDAGVVAFNSADSNQFPGHLSPDSECGSSKACFHDCEGGQCTFIVSWRNVDDDYIFMAMSYRVPDSNEHWIAVGFSKDQEMGDDSVTECIMHEGEVKVQQSFNYGLDNKYLDNKRAALSEEAGRLENGLLHCSFHRKKTYTFDPLVFDLHDDYYLLVAMGEALNGNKIPHTFDVLPPVSDHRIDLETLESLAGEEPPVSPLIKAHGALMILSWVMLTSIGVMTAKYGKLLFPKVNPCGANIWFQIHRGCMLLVAVFTITGVLLMIVQCEGYCQVPQLLGKSHWPLHPPLGILVLILTIVNPVMAFLRPAPKAPTRYVFIWSHWGVGVLAWILAALAIFIGIDLERAHAPPEAMNVMVAWGIYHILALVAMETLPRPLSKLYNVVAERTVQRGRVYNLERVQQDNLGYMAENGNATDPPFNEADSPKKDKPQEKRELTREELKVQRVLLLFHYAVVIIFTFAMMLLVYLYTPPVSGHV